MEAIRIGHHHDPSDGEDGGHNLDRRKKTAVRVVVGNPMGRQGVNEVEKLMEVQQWEGRERGDLLSRSLENERGLCSCSVKLGATEEPGMVGRKETR